MSRSSVSEVEARKLLEAVRLTSAAAARSRAQADADSAARRQAVQAAMDAGLPRAEIAQAAGTHLQNLYRITKK